MATHLFDGKVVSCCAGGDDYGVTSRVLTFDQSTRQQTASVTIVDDEIGDGVKEFSLLVLPEDSELPSPLAEATVQIIDNESMECVRVGVCEGGSVRGCEGRVSGVCEDGRVSS